LRHETQTQGKQIMASRYEARVRGTEENGFFALVVRVDADGAEQVDATYKGRHFATREAGVRSAEKHIAKNA
jgi:hypothetical protein